MRVEKRKDYNRINQHGTVSIYPAFLRMEQGLKLYQIPASFNLRQYKNKEQFGIY
jgi:hypothetical protein